ncbi:MAG: hypothetical protein M1426_06255, partial [Patescibacteria group bacterium]|nr:hypothetical protein [Patescibacteria group bacterium]
LVKRSLLLTPFYVIFSFAGMKQLLLTLIISLCIFSVIGLILRQTVFKPAPAGLQIKSYPESDVFIDGEKIGQTPFSKKDLTEKEVTIRLVPQDATLNLSPWETKVKLLGD